jgi:tetratricopeptide (TPR) repeat protein
VEEAAFPPWPLVIEKSEARAAVLCCGTGTPLSSNLIKDIDMLQQEGRIHLKGAPLIAVTAELLPDWFEAAAIDRNVNIVCYRDMASFARLSSTKAEEIERLFKTKSLDAWALIRASRRHLEAGNLRDAEIEALNAYKRFPNLRGVAGHLSDLLLQNGYKDGALQILAEGLQRHPDDPWLHYRFSKIHLLEGNFDAADAAGKLALDIDPGNQIFSRHVEQIALRRAQGL